MLNIINPARIRFFRKALDLSQAVCAEKIGVSLTTFKDYEKRGDLWLSQAIKLTAFFEGEAKSKGFDLTTFG